MRSSADLLVGDDLFCRDNQFFSCPGNIIIKHGQAVNLAVSINITAVNMDDTYIREKGRQGGKLFPGKRAGHLHGGTVFESIRPQQAAHVNKRDTHGSSLKTPGQCPVGPLGNSTSPLSKALRMIREKPRASGSLHKLHHSD